MIIIVLKKGFAPLRPRVVLFFTLGPTTPADSGAGKDYRAQANLRSIDYEWHKRRP
jgi:hypothetical protein